MAIHRGIIGIIGKNLLGGVMASILWYATILVKDGELTMGDIFMYFMFMMQLMMKFFMLIGVTMNLY